MKNLLTLGILAGLGYVAYKAVSSESPAPQQPKEQPLPPKTTTPTQPQPSDVVPIPIPGVPSWPSIPSVPSGPMPIPGVPTPGAPSDVPTMPTDTSNLWNACWKGFKPTGNSEVDLQTLAKTCAAGLFPVGDPITFDYAGTPETMAIPFEPGYYRIMAVGGSGLTNIDLALTDLSDKIVSADKTAGDLTAVLHPKGSLIRIDQPQVLKLTLTGTGKGKVTLGFWAQAFMGV